MMYSTQEGDKQMKTRAHEMENELETLRQRNRPVKPILGGFLVGSVIGVATALLFAPRTGEETRTQIHDRAAALRDHTSESVKDTISQARSRAYEIKDSVTDTLRERAEELKERGKHTVSRKLDEVSEAAENGKKKVSEF